jgi:hypothetical protein
MLTSGLWREVPAQDEQQQGDRRGGGKGASRGPRTHQLDSKRVSGIVQQKSAH